MSKLAFRAQTVDIAYLPPRQDLFAKNVLMTAQRDFRLGNSLLTFIKGDALKRKTNAILLMVGKAKDVYKFMGDRQYELCIEVLRRLDKVGVLENVISDY
ncbi:MAG: hypothetical protein JRF50_18830 [Deltaproteobacteria bacterium]|nr:hypothetical protein [Deltaproteobacteria bacterium]